MNKLKKYAISSNLMNILIKYQDEVLKFNLNEELIISEDKINSEIKDQPSVYGFLGMLCIKLKRFLKDKEMEMKKEYARLYVKFKTEKNDSTGRPPGDDMVESKIIVNLVYQNKVKEYNQAEEDFGTIEHCVKSFEERGKMIQSLSANIRGDRS